MFLKRLINFFQTQIRGKKESKTDKISDEKENIITGRKEN